MLAFKYTFVVVNLYILLCSCIGSSCSSYNHRSTLIQMWTHSKRLFLSKLVQLPVTVYLSLVPSPSCPALSPRGSSPVPTLPTPPFRQPNPTPPPTAAPPWPRPFQWHFFTRPGRRSWLRRPSSTLCGCSPRPVPAGHWSWTPWQSSAQRKWPKRRSEKTSATRIQTSTWEHTKLTGLYSSIFYDRMYTSLKSCS